jgi:uncharacterized membrane protein YhaH (DUF805 family)
LPIDFRTMSPVYVFAVLFVLSTAWRAAQHRRPHAFAVLAAVLALVAVNTPFALVSARQLHDEGRGYTSRTWRASAAIAFVRSLPSSVALSSNAPDAIRLLTSRDSAFLPMTVAPVLGGKNQGFEREMRALRADLDAGRSIAMSFDRIDWRGYMPSKEELENEYAFPILLRLADATVYGTQR